MFISRNSTAFPSDLCVTTDKEARERCVVVIKGTFQADNHGQLAPAELQRPFVYADEHLGDPATTSIRYECDFAARKRFTDVLIHGHAIPPKENATTQMDVRVDMPGSHKHVRVTGDRVWERGLTGLVPTPPRPFTRLPLTFERAFGGTDTSHEQSKYHACEPRNPIGVGFRRNPRSVDAIGLPLPNIEVPGEPCTSWDSRAEPTGFGHVGRGWQPRIVYAGTYDQDWLTDTFPFLPSDFDDRYFQSAPHDQQLPILRGGETFRVQGVSRDGPWVLVLPRVYLPVRFRFHDHDDDLMPTLDTVLLDCDSRSCVLTWRCSSPLGHRRSDLCEIEVGPPSPRACAISPIGIRRGKPLFPGLSAYIAWRRRGTRHEEGP